MTKMRNKFKHHFSEKKVTPFGDVYEIHRTTEVHTKGVFIPLFFVGLFNFNIPLALFFWFLGLYLSLMVVKRSVIGQLSLWAYPSYKKAFLYYQVAAYILSFIAIFIHKFDLIGILLINLIIVILLVIPVGKIINRTITDLFKNQLEFSDFTDSN